MIPLQARASAELDGTRAALPEAFALPARMLTRHGSKRASHGKTEVFNEIASMPPARLSTTEPQGSGRFAGWHGH